MDYEIARLNLARLRVSVGGSLDAALEQLVKISARTLSVARVGVWTFEEDGALLRCAVSYELQEAQVKGWQTLRTADIPGYVVAIRHKRVVCADDARTHPTTRELRASYLDPLGITSMLDAPVYDDGIVMGVVCHEHVGPARTWTQEEQSFAASVADVVAVLFEKARRLDAEAELRRRDSELREAQKMEALGRLAAAVAHDFTSVLSAMKLLVRQLTKPGTTPETAHTVAAELDDAAGHGLKLAQQLLAFGRAAPAAARPVALGSVLASLDALLEAHARPRAQLAVERTAHDDRVLADPLQLEQVVLNLVTNAVDAIPAGRRGHVRIAVRDATLDDGPRPEAHVVLAVSDDGTGMSDDTRRRVFEPYFTTKPAGKGTGLGLSMVYGTVQQLGGAIHVESREGHGSTFSVVLPRAQLEADV